MRYLVCSLAIIAVAVCILHGTAEAQGVLDKFSRGIINIVVSPLELFQEIGDAYKEYDDMAVALPMGLVKGSWNTARRFGVGLYEVVTFPIPFPRDYRPVIEEPRYLEERTETDSSE